MMKWLVAVACVLVSLNASMVAGEQPPTTSIQNLSGYASRTVWVAENSGHEVKGRLIRVTDSDLIILVNDQQRLVPVAAISAVFVETTAAKRGFFIGLGVGIPLVAVAVGIADKPSSGAGKIAAGLVGALTYGTVGAAIGALHHDRLVVYRREVGTEAAIR